MVYCNGCADNECEYRSLVGWSCSRFIPKTNADKIRAMSDEELAEFIDRQIIDRNIGVPVEAWLDWLKKEVNNDKLEIM